MRSRARSRARNTATPTGAFELISACPFIVASRFASRQTVGAWQDAGLSDEELAAAFMTIALRPAIWEVILTPAAIPDPRPASGCRGDGAGSRRFSSRVKILRWHTAFPVVAPPP